MTLIVLPGFRSVLVFALGLCFLAGLPGSDIFAQAQTKEPSAAAPKKTWRLSVTKAPQAFKLRAADAPLAEITAELSRELKVPVHLSAGIQTQRVTLDFAGLGLEAAVRMLAPQAYIDYEAGGDYSTQAKPLAIYLLGVNEPAPSVGSYGRNNSQAILIEGNTEEGTEAYEKAKESEESPLVVSYVDNRLSVKAKKQPLTVVLFKIASEVGVPFEMAEESSEVVDVAFKYFSFEQAVRALSPQVRVYYRADLQTFDIQPLRILLVGQTKS